MKTNHSIAITTLCDNSALRMDVDLLAEWGVSFLIEDDQNTILFDTGYSYTCVHNALALGKNLSQIKKIVLSHGHSDHVGGLLPVLKSINYDVVNHKTQIIDVIAHPDIWQPKYVVIKGKTTWGGMLTTTEVLENFGASFKFSRKPVWITDNIVTTGEIDMQTDYEQINQDLVVKQNGEFIQDNLLDDQALILKTRKGLIVILGCSHRGVINTLLQAQKITREKRIALVLGGTHLCSASTDRINKTIAALKQLEVQKIGVSHCTGLPIAAKFAHEFGERFFFNGAGNVFES